MIRLPKSPEVKYRKQLQSLVKRMRNDVVNNIIPLLYSHEHEYVNDAYATTLEETFERLRKGYSSLPVLAKTAANGFAMDLNNTNKKRFNAAMKEAIGIDLNSVIQNEGLEDILVATVRSNVNLITSLQQEYFKQIETMVFTETTQGSSATSMIRQLREIGVKTDNKAKFIARDQTAKLNSTLNQQRQQNLGITEYVWRTSSDERVRDNHRSKNGKTFKWNEPPKDTGHPGQDYQCRCVAQPIINLE